MNNIIIRKAKEADLTALENLISELIDSMGTREGIDLSMAIKNCRKFINDNNSYLAVAEKNRDIIGFINFTMRQTVLHYGGSGLIDELVVGGNYRGKGIGKMLMNFAIEKCKELGCCEVEVSTESTNTKAREFYKSYGFEETGIILEKDL
jgi:ribosomal protein S18 acetylase RimI-like enzyme